MCMAVAVTWLITQDVLLPSKLLHLNFESPSSNSHMRLVPACTLLTPLIPPLHVLQWLLVNCSACHQTCTWHMHLS